MSFKRALRSLSVYKPRFPAIWRRSTTEEAEGGVPSKNVDIAEVTKKLQALYDELSQYLTVKEYFAIADLMHADQASWNDVGNQLAQLDQYAFLEIGRDVYAELRRRQKEHKLVKWQLPGQPRKRSNPDYMSLSTPSFRALCATVHRELRRRFPKIALEKQGLNRRSLLFTNTESLRKDPAIRFNSGTTEESSVTLQHRRSSWNSAWNSVLFDSPRSSIIDPLEDPYTTRTSIYRDDDVHEDYHVSQGQSWRGTTHSMYDSILQKLTEISGSPVRRESDGTWRSSGRTLTQDDPEQLMDAIQTYLKESQSSHSSSDFEGWMATGSSRPSSQSLPVKAHRLLVKLSEASYSVPSGCYVSNVRIDSTSYPIGGGGFADVFQGYIGDGPVALKRLRVFSGNMSAEEDKRMKRLCREALVWQQLHHPNILPFLGVDRTSFPLQMCLASPWMPNGDILTYLDRHVPNPTVSSINELLYQVSQGVAYLHWFNIVHGDLRGGNILIDIDHHVRIADFGLSVFAETTQASVTCSNRDGSIAWMAPELIDPKKYGQKGFHRTPATDIYAFACVCLEVYTGNRPFSGIPDAGVILEVLRGIIPSMPGLKDCRGLTIPDKLWNLMQSCWASEPSERPDIRVVVRCLADDWTHTQE